MIRVMLERRHNFAEGKDYYFVAKTLNCIDPKVTELLTEEQAQSLCNCPNMEIEIVERTDKI